jgi:hypothetical protein
VTGGGQAKEGTVYSTVDQMRLHSLYQWLYADAAGRRDRFFRPSEVDHSEDWTRDTTANLFSALVMERAVTCENLISKNEFSGYVEPYESYDFLAYDPANGVHWDPNFRADLADISNTSYAHMPLYGARQSKFWRTSMNANVAIVGNRGPKDGVHDLNSWTYSPDGTWGAHVLYGDGHIDFTYDFAPGRAYFERDGQRYSDNLYAMEDGPEGLDSILSFTQSLSEIGLELQFD